MATTTEAHDDAPTTTKRADATDEARSTIDSAQGSQLSGRSVTINRPASELFAYWRDFGNLASFMENIERIEVLDDARSHWVVKAPGGRTVEWDARITHEEVGSLIAWTSEDGADVANSGKVEFRDAAQRGTIVTATLLYDPPGGIIGRIIATMFQREPAMQARRDLRRFKQLMETGEVAVAARTRAMRDAERN